MGSTGLDHSFCTDLVVSHEVLSSVLARREAVYTSEFIAGLWGAVCLPLRHGRIPGRKSTHEKQEKVVLFCFVFSNQAVINSK